jgi:phage terminase large subunit-like protein
VSAGSYFPKAVKGVEIPKKNGKSELAAAITLKLLCGDGEDSAEVYGCAADRQQASIVYNVAARMVELDAELSGAVKIIKSTKRLIYPKRNSFYQVLSAESYSKQGFNVSGLIFDELFAQPGRELYDTMTKYAGDARRQPLNFLITTAGTNRNSICWEVHTKAKDIIEGRKIDSEFYPVIYGLDEGDDWREPASWYKANPSLGVTIRVETVMKAVSDALENPAEENHLRQFRFNEWVKQESRWISMVVYDRCDGEVNLNQLFGKKCYAGLDLSITTDLSCLALVFPPDIDCDKYRILPFFWLPDEDLRMRVRRDKVPYDLWARQGYISVTNGNVTDYNAIENKILELCELYRITAIGYDPFAAAQMAQRLTENGVNMIPIRQGYSMSLPTKETQRLILSQKIAHGGHPVLRWCFDNVIVKRDDKGNIRPDKEKSTERIDGVVAAVMSVDMATGKYGEEERFIEKGRGLLIL